MAVELFRTATTKPDVIFCDTCFIVDILTHEVGQIASLLGPNDPTKRRAEASAEFFHDYRSQRQRFVSSPYAFAEVGHVLSRKVYERHGYRSWKDFSTADANACRTIYGQTMRLVHAAWRRIEGYDIWFVVPRVGPETQHGFRVEKRVVEAARIFKQAYMGIDWTDAYHIAMGLACGTQWFATTDRAWKDVVEINVFCDA